MVYTIGTGATPSSAPIGSGAIPSFSSSYHIGSGSQPTSTWNPPSSHHISSSHHHGRTHHNHSSVFIGTSGHSDYDSMDPRTRICCLIVRSVLAGVSFIVIIVLAAFTDIFEGVNWESDDDP